MGGDLVGYHSLTHVFGVGQSKMLFRRDVAEHVGSEPTDHRGTDRARDMVVAGRDVGDERPECVERRFAAHLFHAAHVHLDLVHRNVSGSFDHHLYVALPRAPGELAERVELRELCAIAGVGDATGAKAVSERNCDVVLAKNVEHIVEPLVEWVLLAVRHHPHSVQRSTAAHDAGYASVYERQMLDQDSGVESHVVDALLRLMLDHVEQIVGGELLELLVPFAVGSALYRLIDRHGADRNRRSSNDRAPDSIDVAAGREIHHGVGAVLDRDLELFDLAVHVGRHLRIADVGVDLHPCNLPDRHRLEGGREMVDVGGDYETPDCDLIAHQLERKLLALGDEAHRIGDLVPTRVMHLRTCFHRSTPYAGTNRIRF